MGDELSTSPLLMQEGSTKAFTVGSTSKRSVFLYFIPGFPSLIFSYRGISIIGLNEEGQDNLHSSTEAGKKLALVGGFQVAALWREFV